MARLYDRYLEWKKFGIIIGKKAFKMFDIGSFDKKRRLIIHGRNDDVINIRGHRIGSEELESVILKDNNIIDCGCSCDNMEKSKIIVFYASNSKT